MTNMEEFIGDVIGQNFLDPVFWESFARQDLPLFKRVAKKALAILKKALSAIGSPRA